MIKQSAADAGEMLLGFDMYQSREIKESQQSTAQIINFLDSSQDDDLYEFEEKKGQNFLRSLLYKKTKSIQKKDIKNNTNSSQQQSSQPQQSKPSPSPPSQSQSNSQNSSLLEIVQRRLNEMRTLREQIDFVSEFFKIVKEDPVLYGGQDEKKKEALEKKDENKQEITETVDSEKRNDNINKKYENFEKEQPINSQENIIMNDNQISKVQDKKNEEEQIEDKQEEIQQQNSASIHQNPFLEVLGDLIQKEREKIEQEKSEKEKENESEIRLDEKNGNNSPEEQEHIHQKTQLGNELISETVTFLKERAKKISDELHGKQNEKIDSLNETKNSQQESTSLSTAITSDGQEIVKDNMKKVSELVKIYNKGSQSSSIETTTDQLVTSKISNNSINPNLSESMDVSLTEQLLNDLHIHLLNVTHEINPRIYNDLQSSFQLHSILLQHKGQRITIEEKVTEQVKLKQETEIGEQKQDNQIDSKKDEKESVENALTLGEIERELVEWSIQALKEKVEQEIGESENNGNISEKIE